MSPERHAIALASRRLRRYYRGADDEALTAGRTWYAEASAEARRLAREAPRGVGIVGAAAVIAALSPRTQWGQNLQGAREAVRAAARIRGDSLFGDAFGIEGAVTAAAKPYALGDSIRKAARILAGEKPDHVLGGPKVRGFWRAICGDPESVTIDLWAAKAAGFDPDRLTPKRLWIIDAAYRRAAAWAGETPRDFQAIVWLSIRGFKPSDREGRIPA